MADLMSQFTSACAERGIAWRIYSADKFGFSTVRVELPRRDGTQTAFEARSWDAALRTALTHMGVQE